MPKGLHKGKKKKIYTRGVCRECQAVNDGVPVRDWHHRSQPRCTQCGGMLDRLMGIQQGKPKLKPKPKAKPQDKNHLGTRNGRKPKTKRMKNDILTVSQILAINKERGYPIEWTAVLRSTIRSRDGGQCAICAKTNDGERHESDLQALPVHHIDMNKMNCNPMNLISLCSMCHQAIHFGSSQFPAETLHQMAMIRESRVYVYK